MKEEILESLISLRNDIVGQDELCSNGYENFDHKRNYVKAYLFDPNLPLNDHRRIRETVLHIPEFKLWKRVTRNTFIFHFPTREHAIMFDEMTREITKELIR